MTPIESVAIKRSYGVGTLVADFGLGFAALVIVGFTALLLGGFSFLTPWLLVTPPLFFATGFLRGTSDGIVWGKAIALSAPSLLLLGVASSPSAFWRWFRVLRGWY